MLYLLSIPEELGGDDDGLPRALNGLAARVCVSDVVMGGGYVTCPRDGSLASACSGMPNPPETRQASSSGSAGMSKVGRHIIVFFFGITGFGAGKMCGPVACSPSLTVRLDGFVSGFS